MCYIHFLIKILACKAELYLVNRTSILCSNEAVFICANKDLPEVQWTITTAGGTTRSLSFSLLFGTDRVMSRTIDSTLVRAELIFGNSSYYVSSLTIVATLSATIECNLESISYQPDNGNNLDIQKMPIKNCQVRQNVEGTFNELRVIKLYEQRFCADGNNNIIILLNKDLGFQKCVCILFISIL